MSSPLEVRSLVKRYRGTFALKGVSLRVEKGEVFGLLGPNGAGKTTLVKAACGLVRPDSGEVEVMGSPPSSVAARRRLGYLGELFRFPPWLSAEEVIAMHQELIGSQGGEGERRNLLERVGLDKAGDKRVKEMSKGMQQRLGIAQALVAKPELLLLDEPTSALDPAGRREVRELLSQVKAQGTAVLLNSHLLTEVELVSDRVAIISRGEIVSSGRIEELARPRGVEVETASGTRFWPQAGREEAPGIVRSLVQAGEQVFAVKVARSTLEDAYVTAVERGAG